MKKSVKKRTALVIVSVLILSVAAAVIVGDRKSVSSVDNDFTPANIEIAVQEKVGGNDESDGNVNPAPEEKELVWESNAADAVYTAEKEVSVYNTGNASNPAVAYIRVCILPRWTAVLKDENGDVLKDAEGKSIETDVADRTGILESGSFVKEISGNAYTMGDVTFLLDDTWEENWIYGGDGYFYCRDIIEPGSSTAPLLKSVSIDGTIYDYIETEGITLKVDILADSIQTEADALVKRWGSPETLGIEIGADGTLKEYANGGAAGE